MGHLDENARREHKTRNMLHSVVLLGGMGALLALSTWLIWGAIGVAVSLVVVAAMFALAPRVPPEAIMAMYRARSLDQRSGGQLTAMVHTLAERADLAALPRLYVIPSMTLNAFATGTPGHAAIAITEGLLRRLTMREIAGVLAHEMSHIRNNDLWVMGLADVVSRFTQALSYAGIFAAALNVFGLFQGETVVNWFAVLLLYLAPTLSSLLQLGLSRTREYDADLEGAMLTGDPLGLASALQRLEQYTGRFWEDMMLPVPGRRVPYPSILRSHPATADRVARLRALNARQDHRERAPPLVTTEEPMVSLLGFGPIAMRPRYRWPGVWF